MKLRVFHQTRYDYSEPVTLGHNQLHLSPREFPRQRCLTARIRIEPLPSVTRTWHDAFGNQVTYFTLEEPHEELVIGLQAMIEMVDIPSPPQREETSWEIVRERLHQAPRGATLEAVAFTFPSPYIARLPEVMAYAQPSFSPNRSLFSAVRELTERIYTDFKYDSRATNLSTTLLELLRMRRGVCQDFAICRLLAYVRLGWPRDVSGYLVTRPPPGKAKLVGADASHAWLSVYFPEQGWVDFDPTNNCLPTNEHVTLAWGRDYSDVAPIKGLYLGGGNSTLHVAVDISEIAVPGMPTG